MEEVTLQAVLAARDARAAAQRRLLASWGRPLLSVTLNIAGPVKRWALTDFVFRDVLEALEDCLGADLLWKEQTEAVTGLEAVLVCGREAGALKDLAVELETARAAGRLYDLDVIAPDGCKLSRGTPRACLVCGGPAAPCARSRAHGLEAVRAATEDLLRRGAAESLGNLAVEALIAEVDLTPKPGLVDRRNNGAHRDMDRELFHRSARALEPYFRRAAELGMERPDCMAALQSAGRAAEGAMLEATGGVNTHRGAVYACGILTAALGSVLVRGGDVLETAASLARAGTPPSGDSHGGAALRRYGAAGARGEALAGFPHVRRAAAVLAAEGPHAALLKLLAEVEDTNLLHRGGPEGLRFVREQAADILSGPAADRAPRLEALDDACIARNLSPGGSADLLAAAMLLEKAGRRMGSGW